jgi:hypothetical protein
MNRVGPWNGPGGTPDGGTPGSVFIHPDDPAREELRVRYARGEVDRIEYLERSADLGGPTIPDAPADTPPREPPADQE